MPLQRLAHVDIAALLAKERRQAKPGVDIAGRRAFSKIRDGLILVGAAQKPTADKRIVFGAVPVGRDPSVIIGLDALRFAPIRVEGGELIEGVDIFGGELLGAL